MEEEQRLQRWIILKKRGNSEKRRLQRRFHTEKKKKRGVSNIKKKTKHDSYTDSNNEITPGRRTTQLQRWFHTGRKEELKNSDPNDGFKKEKTLVISKKRTT
ncbi:1559_t:CDS:2 [Dentiscutata erythropus]|uniref:1559_t:CDS:1 n=1 Tax=Dentiscutata erythropus TaxID=1348616 RepID=A0A9N8YSD5_9GLOM|nr:1559_t:CDS:2 [Dentiscutata erythropus]